MEKGEGQRLLDQFGACDICTDDVATRWFETVPDGSHSHRHARLFDWRVAVLRSAQFSNFRLEAARAMGLLCRWYLGKFLL